MITVVTPNYNGARYLAQAIESVLAQRRAGVEVEYIVVDGGSTDGSLDILKRYASEISRLIVEPDHGPASAINKGLTLARGEILAWLNADDHFHPGALARVEAAFAAHPLRALGFGRCRIVNEDGAEIRRAITRFKEACFPFSSHFLIQTLNYISQPAMFFRRSAFERAGPLREDLRAAFDYDLTLRLWRQGGGFRISGPPLADFRWRPDSISGRRFREQFREEYEAARRDAGRWAPQVWLHAVVRWGIVAVYSGLTSQRRSGPLVRSSL